MADVATVDLAAARSQVRPAEPSDMAAIRACLEASDLTLAGVGSTDLRLFVLQTRAGQTAGVTGYEIAGSHALVRSVAVAPAMRGHGLGGLLAELAFDHATGSGAHQLWLFARRTGAFWQRLGFRLTPTDELVTVLRHTQQVSHFMETGQVDREIAWTRAAIWPT